MKRTAQRLERGDALSYKDIASKKIEQGQDQWRVQYITFMQLVRDGVACHGADVGGESRFVHRERWLPDLAWDPPEPEAACADLALRYLAGYGPADARDLAFWHGANQTDAKRWLKLAGDRCCTVEVDGRELWCRRNDLDELNAKPPAPSRWPVRLLYRFDPLLLATKDKAWLVDEEHYKAVWRPSAHVAAVVLVRGRIAGTWRYDRKGPQFAVNVAEFPDRVLANGVRRQVERQVRRLAAYLDARDSTVQWQRNGG